MRCLKMVKTMDDKILTLRSGERSESEGNREALRQSQKSARDFRPQRGKTAWRRFRIRQRGLGIRQPFLRMPHLRDEQADVHGDSPSIVFFSTWPT